MSIIIDNNCTDVIFKGKQSDALHFGGTECWKKKKEAYITTGKIFDNTINQKATVFTRSATPPSEAITVADISENNDKSIVTWYDEPTTTQYYYTDADTIYLNPDCSIMFMSCKIDELDLTQFDWSNVTNVTYMFGDYAGKSLDFNGISIPNITSMDNMFGDDGDITSEKFNINLGGLDIPNVTCMTKLFEGAMNVSVTLPTSATNLDTMKEMFSKANDIDINWNNIDTSTVTDMSQMFMSSCGISSGSSDTFIVPINTSNVVNMNQMFYIIQGVKIIDISSFDLAKVTNVQEMFSDVYSTEKIIYGEKFVLSQDVFPSTLINDETNPAWHLFYESPDVSKPTGKFWDNGYWEDDGTFIYKVVANNDIQGLMCYSGKTSFKRSLVPPSDEIINNAVEKECCPMDKNKLSATWPDPDPNINTQWWYCKADKVYLNPNSEGSFAGLETYKELDLSGFDFSDVTNMEAMFNYCKSLTNIIFPDDIDVSNVTTLRLMFEDCYSLVHLDLSKFHTTKAENFDEIFRKCTSLESLDISGFDTSNVTTMTAMFSDCSKLSTITYGDKFILTDSLKNNQNNFSLAAIFEACPANKPNWTGGTWDQDGSFVLTV